MVENVLESLAIFFVVAIFAEAVWENVKKAIPFEVSDVGDRLVVMALAIYLCVQTGADMTAAANLPLPWPIGQIITGIICSRGANYIHDFVGKWRTIDSKVTYQEVQLVPHNERVDLK